MKNAALLLIDIQKDFCKGGALAVPNGDEVVPVANAMINLFTDNGLEVFGTQDWHPLDHKSFAVMHKDKKVFDVIDLNGLKQVLWPTHCVANSTGADFHDDLLPIPTVICKGMDPEVDSYSGFFDNGKIHNTDLDKYLKEAGITDLFIMGLATDYCVKFTALDAVALGYNVNIIADGCQGVNLNNNDVGNAINDMIKHGIRIMNSHLVVQLFDLNKG